MKSKFEPGDICSFEIGGGQFGLLKIIKNHPEGGFYVRYSRLRFAKRSELVNSKLFDKAISLVMPDNFRAINPISITNKAVTLQEIGYLLEKKFQEWPDEAKYSSPEPEHNYLGFYSKTESDDAQKLESLVVSFGRQDNNRMVAELMKIYDNIPGNYRNSMEIRGKLFHKFWSDNEKDCFIEAKVFQGQVIPYRNAYPKCCCSIAMLLAGANDYIGALEFVETGLKLESDHPDLLCQKGLVLYKMGLQEVNTDLFRQALEVYESAFCKIPFITNSQRAKALRGMGCALIELGDLIDAGKRLQLSQYWEEKQGCRT